MLEQCDPSPALAELLKEAELVPSAVLARAQNYSEKSGRPLWFVLLREGLLTEDKLFRLLEAQHKLPVLSDDQLDGVVVAPELKQAITAALAGHLGILPLERSTDGRRAALAMVDPSLDLSTLLPKLASHGVVEIRRFLIRFGTLRLGMDMYYNQAWEAGESAPAIEPIPAQAIAREPSSKPDVAPSKPDVPLSKPEVSPSKPELPPSKPDVSPSKPELPPSKPDVSLSKPEVSLSKPEVPPSKPDVSLSKPEVSLSKPEVPPSKPDVSLSKPEIPGSKSQVPPSKPELPQAKPEAASKPEAPLSRPEFPTRPEISSSKVDVVPLGKAELASRPEVSSKPEQLPSRVSSKPEVSAKPDSAIPSKVSSRPEVSTKHAPPIPQHSKPPRVLPPPIPPLPPAHKAEPPPIPKQAVPAPIPNLRSGPIRRRLQMDRSGPLSSNDLIVEERPSNLNLNRDVLRVPTRMLAPEPMGEQAGPIVDALFRCATTLLDQLAAQYDSDWPTLVVAQCGTLCDRIGLLPRARRELLLVARMHAVLTVGLVTKGSLPPPRRERLGYVCDDPLDGLLTTLQSDFLDFVRLPQDDDPPLGVRIISTVLEGLYLCRQGLGDEKLAEQLRGRFGDSDIARLLLEHFADEPPQFADRTDPPVLRAKKQAQPPKQVMENADVTDRHQGLLRIGWPTPATMPDVAWSIEVVSDLPEEGLLPYPSPAKPKRPQVPEGT